MPEDPPNPAEGEVRALVLRSAGTNCDEETAYAFRLAGAIAERVHVGALLRRERRLDEFDILALPGGFSYGDDLGAGTVLANRLRAHLRSDLEEFVGSGRLVLGICNGFQVLVRLGLLPGWPGEKAVSLVENACGKFVDRWVTLRVETDISPFLRGRAGGGSESLPALGPGATFRLPVAHREGRFVVRDREALERLRAQRQIALSYVRSPSDREPAREEPFNPNGSVEGIAGIVNESGNVLGLMPHPERHVHRVQGPAWTRDPAVSGTSQVFLGEGFALFAAAVEHARARLREARCRKRR